MSYSTLVRASRLLQILLLLQNRGRMTAAALARELEVTPRTILRDVDALTEAGLPMVVGQGYRGGIELGFDYRVRLTGMSADEAEAIGVLLGRPVDDLAPLGIKDAAIRARRKLFEAFPDAVRTRAVVAAGRFRFAAAAPEPAESDPRVEALAAAVRDRRIVRVRAFRADERLMHPTALVRTPEDWVVEDALVPERPERLDECGDVNISSKTFE
jgi:predicted DNA-binding transcriptional regulator YafY